MAGSLGIPTDTFYKMNILYASHHSPHEYYDYKMFVELGHDVFPIGMMENPDLIYMSSYSNPHKPGDDARPAIPEAKLHPELCGLDIWGKSSQIAEELLEWADLFYIQHKCIKWLKYNWDNCKKHNVKVLVRGAGQNIPSTERALLPYREDGLLIVRYSPNEKNIPGYCGEDAMIRFYGDPEEWKGWNGENNRVITVCQSIGDPGHGKYRNWDSFDQATDGLNRKVFGNGNKDLGDLWGGRLSYEQLKAVYRDNRVYFYAGTMPAQYTMNFIESLMTGIPVVSIGPARGNPWFFEPGMRTFEVPELIENGINGYFSDDIDELHGYIELLMNDYDLAKEIGSAGREKAIEVFSKDRIFAEWEEFLSGQ